jgi:uncharacterized protein YjiS (DUF1127 family)
MAVALSRALADWMIRSGDRRQLAQMNDRTARDIGLDRQTINPLRNGSSFGR